MKLLQTWLVAGALLAASLSAQALSLLDGDYELQSWRINGQELSAKAIDEQQRPVTMSIKGAKISGFSGCNRFMGAIEYPDFKIGPLAGTRMACLDTESSEKERDVLQLLNKAKSYDLTRDGKLVFKSGNTDQLVFVHKAQLVEKVIQIAPETVPCTAGAAKMDCLQFREKADGPWQLLYGGIEGFNYAPGKLYTLRISEAPVADAPADGSRIKRTLLQIISTYREEDVQGKAQ
ncbi:META and DUF4377 domain-containing protein [Amantichitinum ursilacus]|uniref:META domain protein n=1 Tax=Amantichitinum ursilacus TaxID=857265 RepID=A0A0N0GNP8_9NEIS|nr:META and DUF4377 domain-containing protein [Amantichitinum ursilacus]KPC52733.1 META domain protein [Amantichitinum ursilacus]